MSGQSAKEIAALLRQERRARHISQKEVGAKSGIPGNRICEYERGITSPSLATILKWTKGLGLRLTFDLEDDP